MSSFPGSVYERYLVSIFVGIDEGDTGLINVNQLHLALLSSITYLRYRVISLKTARMLMTVVDRERTGTINMQQFFLLYRIVFVLWKSFRQYDPNNSGWIKHVDLRAAMACNRLQFTDYQLNEVLSYDSTRGWISLDHYLQLCAMGILARLVRR
ncbi:sorcin-like [Dermacentor albipictus]|uniref:sorcin-like n=1 Tax=Dermacentor albipictus TaxID=60249 RepID=UPI0031FCE955